MWGWRLEASFVRLPDGRRDVEDANATRMQAHRAVSSAVDSFFDVAEHFELLCAVLSPPRGVEPPISLRLLQFAVRKALERTKYFDFYASAINENGKARFDAFRRIGARAATVTGVSASAETSAAGAGASAGAFVLRKHGRELVTTLAQANFFRLLIAHGILQDILLHVDHYKALQSRSKRPRAAEVPAEVPVPAQVSAPAPSPAAARRRGAASGPGPGRGPWPSSKRVALRRVSSTSLRISVLADRSTRVELPEATSLAAAPSAAAPAAMTQCPNAPMPQ